MNKTKYFSLFLIFISASSLSAQENRYVVFFSDKNESSFTISAPEDYLSARAIARRINQNIIVTELDLPVNQNYIDGLETAGASVFFTTKWLNGALIQTTPEVVGTIETLSYVDSVVFVAPGVKLTKSSRKFEDNEDEALNAVTDAQLRMLGLDLLHQEGFTGEGLIIAFFDGGFSGVNNSEPFQHIFNTNRMLHTFNLVINDPNVYQSSSHGTKSFSVTAGLVPGDFAGSAYGADFMLFITEDSNSEFTIEEYNWLIAAEKADSAGVDIINSSLGYFDFDDASMNYTYEDMDGETTIVTQAANLAAARGMLVVTSVGNEGDKQWKYLTAPADAQNILSVGSVDANRSISAFSSLGPTADGRIKPEVVALGGSTSLIDPLGNLTTGSGTSFSAPLITGLAAALWQAYPDLTNLELIDLILENSSRFNGPDNTYGYGIPSYRVIVSGNEENALASQFSVFPNPVTTGELTLRYHNSSHQDISIQLHDLSGVLVKNVQLTATADMEYSIFLDDLRSGVYILTLNGNNGIGKFRIVKY